MIWDARGVDERTFQRRRLVISLVGFFAVCVAIAARITNPAPLTSADWPIPIEFAMVVYFGWLALKARKEMVDASPTVRSND